MTKENPPFVSGRSPSSARSREERRNPPDYPDADRVALLARLVELEYELTEFLDVAAREADSPEERSERVAAAAERRDRASRLSARLRDIGAGPPEPGDMRPQSLPVPERDLRHLASDARADALAENIRFVEDAYAEARARDDTGEDLRSAGLAQ